MDPRTLEAFSKCKDDNDFHELCNTVSGCEGCSLENCEQEFGFECYHHWEYIFPKIFQLPIRRKKAHRFIRGMNCGIVLIKKIISSIQESQVKFFINTY